MSSLKIPSTCQVHSLLLKNQLTLTYHQLVLLIISPQMHLLTLFLLTWVLLCPISHCRTSPATSHQSADGSTLTHLASGLTHWPHLHSWVFYLLKSLQGRPCLKTFGFPMAFCIRTSWKQILLKYLFSDCLGTFPFGSRKFSKIHLENISLLCTKESLEKSSLSEAESWKQLRDSIFLHLIERGNLCPEN